MNLKENYHEMDATVDHPSPPTCLMWTLQKVLRSTSELNLSDLRPLWLRSVAHFLNSTDVVCISIDESNIPPPQKKKLIDFFMDKTRTPAFLNSLHRYDPQPGGSQKQASSATGALQLVDQQKLEVVGSAKAHIDMEAARHFCILRTTLCAWKGLELQPKAEIKARIKKGSMFEREHILDDDCLIGKKLGTSSCQFNLKLSKGKHWH